MCNHKACRKGKTPPSLKVYTFEAYTKLCVVGTLEEYFKRTKVWRGKDKSQLLLSFVKPHNPVVSLRISRWITNVLREAGIDNEFFKGILHVHPQHLNLGCGYFLGQKF